MADRIVKSNFKKFQFKTELPPAYKRVQASGKLKDPANSPRSINYSANKYKRSPK